MDQPNHSLSLRRLGRSDVEIPAITFGAMARGTSRPPAEERIRTIQSAIDAGITAIDTAPLYDFGDSEELVGRAIEGRRDRQAGPHGDHERERGPAVPEGATCVLWRRGSHHPHSSSTKSKPMNETIK